MNEGNSPETNGEQLPVPQPPSLPEKLGEDHLRLKYQLDIIRERTERTLRMQERLLPLIWLLGILLAVTVCATIVMAFLSGWSQKTGFNIASEVLIALITASIAETAGLLVVYFNSLKFPEE